MQDLDQEERARWALDTDRAEEPEVIQAFLDSLFGTMARDRLFAA